MNERAEVDELIDRFRDWLETAHADAALEDPFDDEPAGESDPAGEPGLIDLIEEFTALRHDVKLLTRSNRGLSDQNETTLLALKQAIDQFRSIEPREEQAVWTAGKALATGLADLHESLERGHGEIERARRQIAEEAPRAIEAALEQVHSGRSWIKRRLLRKYHEETVAIVRRDNQSLHELFDAFREGYGLIQNRLTRVMTAEKVAPIPCLGQPVDPQLMTVLELVDNTDAPPGTVTSVLRTGYAWRGRVLRFAEVQAVRCVSTSVRPEALLLAPPGA